MIEVRIECIVEGQGEELAVPLLVRRWLKLKARHAFETHNWQVGTVVTKSCAMITHDYVANRPGVGVEWHVRTALAKGAHGILVLVDADDHCPAELGTSLVRRVSACAPHIPASVVVANHEYEAWFLADMWSLRRLGFFPPANRLPILVPPERSRSAKQHVNKLLGRTYSETGDQAQLTDNLSLNAGQRRRSRSFRKLEKELSRLTREARHRANAPQ